MEVPQLTGVQNQINSWYTNKAVLHQIRDITYSRETKWQVILPSNNMWGIRHRFLGSIDYLEKRRGLDRPSHTDWFPGHAAHGHSHTRCCLVSQYGLVVSRRL